MNEKDRIQLYRGEQAHQEYAIALSRAFEEDATGGVFVYRLVDGVPRIEAVTDPQDQRIKPRISDHDHARDWSLIGSDLIIIDSGNTSGDCWKFIFHPAAECATFICETDQIFDLAPESAASR